MPRRSPAATNRTHCEHHTPAGRKGSDDRGLDTRRKAVAATLTSVLVFSSILVANQIVYTSEIQWLHAVSFSELERAEALNSRILAASAVFDSLSSVQRCI